VREVNDVMLDAYLDGVDYFRLVLANGTSGTSLDSAHRLDQLSVRQHGVVAEMNSLSAALSAILFGSRHFDVFGWFLPLDLKDLDSSSRTVCDIYASRDMLRARRGGSDVTYVVRGNTSIDQHLSTLDRYMQHIFYICHIFMILILKIFIWTFFIHMYGANYPVILVKVVKVLGAICRKIFDYILFFAF